MATPVLTDGLSEDPSAEPEGSLHDTARSVVFRGDLTVPEPYGPP
jgi:hypothetical protein